MLELATSVKIDVETAYLEEQSSPIEDKYLFSYTVTISNLSQQEVTLKSRHWIITDGNGKVIEVQGDGVVGKTPTLKPGGQYQYTSGTVLNTPFGVMGGYYTMQTNNQQQFNATIPTFRLSIPGLLH